MSETCQVCRRTIGENRRQADTRLMDDLAMHNDGYAGSCLCHECALLIAHDDLPQLARRKMEPLESLANRSQFYPWRMQAVADGFAGIHRYLQAEMLCALIRVLKTIASRADDSRYVDGRNQYAYKLVADMIAAVRDRI